MRYYKRCLCFVVCALLPFSNNFRQARNFTFILSNIFLKSIKCAGGLRPAIETCYNAGWLFSFTSATFTQTKNSEMAF